MGSRLIVIFDLLSCEFQLLSALEILIPIPEACCNGNWKKEAKQHPECSFGYHVEFFHMMSRLMLRRLWGSNPRPWD